LLRKLGLVINFMPHLLLHARNISKTFVESRKRRPILDNISFDIERGDRVAFVGPNGSGKTTLLRILLNVEPIDTGEIIWHGNKEANFVAYVPQDYRHALFPWFRLRTNLAMASPAYRKLGLFSPLKTGWMESLEKEYRVIESSYNLHLDLDKFPYELSGGEQQIFLLIRSLISAPQVLVLDEPLSAVDYGRKKLIQESLGARIAASQIALLFSTHDFEEAVKLSDRVVVLGRNTGKIKVIVPVKLPWPRKDTVRTVPEFIEAVDAITKATL
jgi:NitT/TauT family transport system ATP-binding protein